MPARKRTRKQREGYLAQVADLYLRRVTPDGRILYSQHQIAEYLEVNDAQITYDLKILQKRWRASQEIDTDEAKGKELAKLDLMEAEYWAAWERSKRPKEKSRSGKREGEKTVLEAFLEKEERDGDPRFLDGVLKCVAKRCEILGLDEAVSIKIIDEEAEHIARETGLSREEVMVSFQDYKRRRGIA